MNDAILALLERLEAIEADYNGLGETNVREHMSEDLFHGFLMPKPGFRPSGEYGLEPEANLLVAKALGQFIKAGNAAAKREGLKTFQQRLAAFQSPAVMTSRGTNTEDYFGVANGDLYDEMDNKIPEKFVALPSAIKTVRKACTFDWIGDLNELQETLNSFGDWKWAIDDENIESIPQENAQVRIREGMECLEPDGSVTPAEYGFMALIHAPPEQLEKINATLRTMLIRAGAKKHTEINPYWW
jgi:hypothetical protein